MPNKKKDELAPIWERLTWQIYSSRSINYESAKIFAKNILVKRGHLNSNGTPTFEGIQRGLMTPEQRAIDRAGGNYDDYEYDSEKNYAYKKRKNK